MLLALDIGNTNITIGVYEGDKLRFVSRMATDRLRMEDQYAIELRDILDIYGVRTTDPCGAIISSVVPQLTNSIKRAVMKLTGLNPLCVGVDTKDDLKVAIDQPDALGADLVVGCVAAREQYGCPCIILDLGTATTISVMDKDCVMRGGAIIPGIGISLDALTSRAALLPGGIGLKAPDSVIGTGTVTCMQSGIIYGNAAMIDGMCSRIETELGTPCRVIATGGLAKQVIAHCEREVEYSDNLLLEGLRLIYERTVKS